MKRIGYLYEKMLNKTLIQSVILKGAIGKKKRKDVIKVLSDVEGYTDKIYQLLETRSYKPTKPRIRIIRDQSSGKEREISIVPYFPDGIMHQLVTEVMRPVLMRGMYYWSCASIPKRGNIHAVRYVNKHLRNDAKGTKYCAKMDIYHYYQNIQIPLLMQKLERKIKDREFLNLIELIVTSNPNEGLSIGFYINQWLANFFLEDLDRLICSLDGVKYYVRNMDDLVLLGSNKKKLHRAVDAIKEYLSGMKLELKPNWQVFQTDSRGIDFVGYRFYHYKTILRRRNFLKYTRQCRRVRKILAEGNEIPLRTAQGLISRNGQLNHCNGIMVREKYFYGLEMPLKDVIRNTNNQPSMVGDI